MSDWLVIIALLGTPWVAAAFTAITLGTRLRGGGAASIAAAVVGLGFLAAGAVALLRVLGRPVSSLEPLGAIQLDAVALTLTILVLGLSWLIQSFAVRYLRGDPRQGWFVIAANLLTAFTVLMVCAGSVAVFAVAWVGSGASLLALLATYWPLAQARDGVRRTLTRFLLADAAFLAGATILLVAAGGDAPLASLGAVTGALTLPLQLAAAALLVIGALARSSQLPFQGWLPFTLAAPTPVSALMHAGVVNAGAILLIRFSPAIAQHGSIMIVVFLAGAATLVCASAVRLVRPDVKGRLVFSTMAQMGFMIMACGLGLFAAAIFHLVAHSLFKSSLFLGAGMGVGQHAVDRDLPAAARRSPATVALAVGVGVIVAPLSLGAAEMLVSPGAPASSIGLLAFVTATAAVTLATALATHLSIRTAVTGILAIVGLAFGYVLFLNAFTTTLQPSTPVDGAPVWLLILPAAGLLALQLLARNPRPLAPLRDLIYSRCLAIAITRPTSFTGVAS